MSRLRHSGSWIAQTVPLFQGGEERELERTQRAIETFLASAAETEATASH